MNVIIFYMLTAVSALLLYILFITNSALKGARKRIDALEDAFVEQSIKDYSNTPFEQTYLDAAFRSYPPLKLKKAVELIISHLNLEVAEFSQGPKILTVGLRPLSKPKKS